MSLEAIIFDCDGTLVDTEIMSARIDVAYFAKYGIIFESPEQYLAEFMGVAKQDTVKILNARHGTTLPEDDFQEEFTQLMIERIPADMHFFPESVEVLRSLAARGVPMAIASNGQRPAVIEELRHAGYLALIPEDRVVAVTDAARPKPAPDIYIEAARRLGARPQACLVVEDSVPGAMGGVAAGMTVIGYTGFARDKAQAAEQLKNAGCISVISDLSEVIPFIEGKGLC